jgi:hypothetical protein
MIDLNYNKMLAEMTRYMKYLFEQSRISMQMMFDHADRVTDFVLSQGDVGRDEGQKRLKEWLEDSKKIRDDYMKQMGEHFKRIDSYFGGGTQ